MNIDDVIDVLRKHYKIIIPIVLVMFIILGVLISNSFWALMPEEGKAKLERAKSLKFDNLEELFKYYECEYYGSALAGEEGYREQISAKLRLRPSEGKMINEQFYLSLLEDIAEFREYVNFIIVDEENNIKVKVICENFEISKITINGIENYFEKKKEELRLREKVEFAEVNLTINDENINNAIKNGWDSNQNFGTKDSMFDGYDIYFDEGIKVKKIQGKIYNIVFTNDYKQPIVNGLTVQDAHTDIIKRLGTPTFTDYDLGLIGYKGQDIYVFFGNHEISIYRNTKADVSKLFDLIDSYRKDEIDLLEFMNQLTYEWPDYNEYTYEADKLYISYPHKGFEIKVNYENERGFIFYNNFNAAETKISEYLDSEDFKAYLQLDTIFVAEQNKMKKQKELIEGSEKFGDNFLDNDNYYINLKKTEKGDIVKIHLISKNKTLPDREINDSISYFAWINNDYLIFSKSGIGLYGYNVNTGDTIELVVDKNAKFEITGSGKQYIVYDGKEQRFEI